MVYGMPVVTTSAVGASLDLVATGITGYTYEAGDHEALAEHLAVLLNDASARHRMGEAARCRVKNYNYGVCVDGIVAALESVC